MTVNTREPSGRTKTVTVSLPRRSTCVAGVPAETVDFVVTDDGPAALTNDHAAGLLNHDRITLAHLAVGAAYVIKTSRAVLRRRWYESALRPRRR